MNNITYIKRDINYYQLEFDFEEDINLVSFFKEIKELSRTRAKIRYQKMGDKYIYFQGVEESNSIFSVKVRCVRLDVFPEIIDMDTDNIKAIESAEKEGIMETTHFIIDFSNKKTFMALEYNHLGAKISDIVQYFKKIGVRKKMLKELGFVPVVNVDVTTLKQRLERVSEFSMKIHKDNIPELEKIDGDIFQYAKASVEHFENDYALIDIKIDYKKFAATPKIGGVVDKLIDFITRKPANKHIFNYLKVKGEDNEKNNLLEIFDLLQDKIYSPIRVQKKKKQKTIVSEDILEKMKGELTKMNFQ